MNDAGSDEIKFGVKPTVTDIGNGRVYPEDCPEISGFGGGYEDQCRKMLRGALEYLDANPRADPQFRGMKGVFGVVKEENDDAKALTDAIAKAGDNDFTGAMHHIVVAIAVFVHKNGWDRFVEEKRSTITKGSA